MPPLLHEAHDRARGGPPVLDVVVPVHDEEDDLEPCLRRLHAHLTEAVPWVAENFESTTVDGVTLHDLTRPVG
jgi:hypothetical protein